MTRQPPLPARKLAASAVAATLALSVLAPLATASTIDASSSRIADAAQLSAGGRSLQLRGVVRCSACKGFTLGATVSQTGSGAIAQGGVRCTCRGTAERWLLTARTREATAFRAGAARVCVWVTARSASGKAVDARQWCEDVRLTFAEV